MHILLAQKIRHHGDFEERSHYAVGYLTQLLGFVSELAILVEVINLLLRRCVAALETFSQLIDVAAGLRKKLRKQKSRHKDDQKNNI